MWLKIMRTSSRDSMQVRERRIAKVVKMLRETPITSVVKITNVIGYLLHQLYKKPMQ